MARVRSFLTATGLRLTFGSRLHRGSVSASTSTVGVVRSSTAGGWSSLGEPRAGPSSPKVPTIGQFLHRWLEDTVAPNLAPLTYAIYESHVKNYLTPGIGALRLDRLRVADVQAWLNRLSVQCQCCAQGKDAQDRERETAGEIWQQTNDMPWLIFTGRYGTPIDPRTLNRRFTARCHAAG